LLRAGMRVRELPIPTYYGDEICYVNGLKYAWDVAKATLKCRLHDLSIFYDSKFDCGDGHKPNDHYYPKLGFESPHTLALELVPVGAKVLDIGCAGGYMSMMLERERGCQSTAVDKFPLPANVRLTRFIEHDLNRGVPDVTMSEYDEVLLLDVIEHLSSPEMFFDRLRDTMKSCTSTRLIISTPNIGFFIMRLMLLLGQFNYGKQGILDMTHTRLFTFYSLRQLLEQRGFQVLEIRGIPAPFPVALGNNLLSRFLVAANKACLRLWPTLFSYQILVVAQPIPSLELLLRRAVDESSARANKLLMFG
jgi:2-polyprenyl-3-methyl-5-hydroxy-6-metoxy-1,4-benzoquinol methylase